MPIHRRNNDILTVEQLEELNSYQLHKYQAAESRDTKPFCRGIKPKHDKIQRQ